MKQSDTLITVKPSAPAAKSTGSLWPLRTPRGHSMSPKMFLMQPIRYSCRSSIMPSEFLHARITPSWAWFSSHSEISMRAFWEGVEKGLVVRDRGACVGTSPSTAPLQTGWGVLTHTDRKHGACSQGTQPLLSGIGSRGFALLCVCVCVCVYEHAPGGTGAHTCACVQGLCVHRYACVCVCVCVCVRARTRSSREQCLGVTSVLQGAWEASRVHSQ